MRLLTIREVVKRHSLNESVLWLKPIEEQLELADTFEEIKIFSFVDKVSTGRLTYIKGRYINWDWYYINEN
jgi:hypothetical protein